MFTPAYKKHQRRTIHIVYAVTKQQRPCCIKILQILSYHNDHVTHCNLQLLLSRNFNNLTLASTRLILHEDDVDALKYVGLLTIYKILLTLRLLMSYIYGTPSKARNANVVYIWTYVWQR